MNPKDIAGIARDKVSALQNAPELYAGTATVIELYTMIADLAEAITELTAATFHPDEAPFQPAPHKPAPSKKAKKR